MHSRISLIVLCSFAAILSQPRFLEAAPTVGGLKASPQSIVAGTSTTVTVSIQISDPTVLPNGVNLLQVDSTGNAIAVLGAMTPSGNGTFTLTPSFNPALGTSQIGLQASAAFQGVLQRVKSAVLNIAVTSPPPTITINPTTLGFPTQIVNTTSAAQSFTITNSGTQTVAIGAITTSGDFAISSNLCPASLAVSANCSVGVVFSPTATGTRSSSVVITDNASGSPQSVALTGTGGQQPTGPITITGFNPAAGPIGTVVNVALTGFTPSQGIAPTITMAGLAGGTISAPLSAAAANTFSFVVPPGAATGPFSVSFNSQSATSPTPFAVTPSSNFTIAVGPATATLIQGQSVTYAVTLNSQTGFNSLAALSLNGLPQGVASSFSPASITAGQTSILTLSAPPTQPLATANLSVSAAATVDAIALTQSASMSLAITGPTTSFLGRTVVADSLETQLAGVTVTMLGLDGGGRSTACVGKTVSDNAGNFALSGLGANCTGPQLIGFGGNNVTSPAGKYAGVNLIYTLSSGHVTVSPVLVHLPRIDKAETFTVQQNAAADQTYSFNSMPGVTVTVYAHTTFTQEDGTQPNPFSLVAVPVPIDRLPEAMPATNAGVMAFIVAFQPANVTSSQPVAVNYPNTLTTDVAPGTTVPLMTLDPTLGRMVNYGTGTVSADGTQVIPDIDPSTGASQHRFGIVHFDWHGWVAPQPSPHNPCPTCPAATAGDPVDLSSGLQVLNATDLSISGTRGSISVERVYRTLTTNNGTFGLGHELSYAWQLNTSSPGNVSALNLIRPDGNQFLFSKQPDATLKNGSIPWLQGAVLTAGAAGTTTLRFRDGTVYSFHAFGNLSALTAITDRNGNTISIEVVSLGPVLRISKITDPVGRSISLAYDSSYHAISATDPIGRKVLYTYNTSGTLATVTDANGGVTKYQYDSQNRMISITDARGVVMFQDTFDATGRVSQQLRPDGGVFKFNYLLAAALVGNSPVLATSVTDPLGNQTTYRFNIQGVLTDVKDALGQTKTFTLSPGTNLVVQVSGPAQCDVCGLPGQGTMNYKYDSLGNQLSSTDALGYTTTFTYDSVFNQLTSTTDPLGHKASYAYDNSGNLTSLTDENGNSNKYSYGGNGLLIQSIDPLGNATAISYDNSANPVSVTDALGNITTAVFDGVSRPVSVVDPLGRTSKIKFDLLDRITSTRDGRGSTAQFRYDGVGNLLAVTDPRGYATTFTYDKLDRVNARNSALGKSESYQYDLDGNLIQYTDRRGQSSNFSYDLLNRLVKEAYQDGAVVSRTYDPYSRLLTVSDSVGGFFDFGYDLNGSLITQGEPAGTINYTRDTLHRVATRAVGGQSAIQYTYDAAGNSINSSMPALGMTYAYDARNLPIFVSRTNGVNSSYVYDPLGRVLSVIHSKGTAMLNSQTYSYDPEGNRISSTSDLTQALITSTASSAVDQANELLVKAQTQYTYDSNGNRLSETGPAGVTTYGWDSRNRLASVSDSAGNSTSLRYDFDRNLIEVDHSNGLLIPTQKFVIDSLTNVVSLTDNLGLPVSVLTGTFIDSHYGSIDSSGNAAFGIEDALGNTVAVTNSAASFVSKIDYESYGQIKGAPTPAYPFAFTGRTPIFAGIYYYRSRFYDSVASRFLSEDRLSFGGGDSNLYRYVRNNPVNRRDPNGQGIVRSGFDSLACNALFYFVFKGGGWFKQIFGNAACSSALDNIPPPPDTEGCWACAKLGTDCDICMGKSQSVPSPPAVQPSPTQQCGAVAASLGASVGAVGTTAVSLPPSRSTIIVWHGSTPQIMDCAGGICVPRK